MSDIIIVTGGAGFIGSHVVDALIVRGHTVHVIDDLSTGKRENVNGAATLHELDIRDAKLTDLFSGLQPTKVVHLAAQIDLRRSVRAPVEDADINIMGGLHVLEAARAAGVRHITYSSTAAAYGMEKPVPTSEDEQVAPVAPYGVSKVAFEMYLRAYRHLHGMDSMILRFANVYGPRQTVKGEAGVVAIFFDLIRNGKAPMINGDGEQTRDFVFVTDVAESVVRAVEKGSVGTCNISTGKETSVNTLYGLMKGVSGTDVDAEYGPGKPGDERRVCLDPARAYEILGWAASVSVDDGVRRTYESYGQVWK